MGQKKPGPVDLANVWTVQALAEAEQLNPSRVRQLLGQGRFPRAFKLGKSWLIPHADVEDWRTKHRDRRYTHWKSDT